MAPEGWSQTTTPAQTLRLNLAETTLICGILAGGFSWPFSDQFWMGQPCKTPKVNSINDHQRIYTLGIPLTIYPAMVPQRGFWTMKPCPWPEPGVCCWAMLSPHQAHPKRYAVTGVMSEVLKAIFQGILGGLGSVCSLEISGFVALFVPNVCGMPTGSWTAIEKLVPYSDLTRPEVRGSPDQGDQEQKTWLWRPAGSTHVFKMMLMRSDEYW